MNPIQTYFLPGIALISGIVVLIAVIGYICLYRYKMLNAHEKSRGSGLKLLFVLALLLILSLTIWKVWSLYHGNCIENLSNFQDMETFCDTQTTTITKWLIHLLNSQFGAAAVVISLLAVVMKLTSSAYSIRVLDVIFSPIHGNKWALRGGLAVYSAPIVLNVFLILVLSFGALELSDLRTVGGFLAIPLYLILCVVAFIALILFFFHVLNTRQSDHVVHEALKQVSILNSSDDKGNHDNRQENKDGDNPDEEKLQLVFNVINAGIQQSDIHSAKSGIKQLSEKMGARIKDPAGIKNSLKREDPTESPKLIDKIASYFTRVADSIKAAPLFNKIHAQNNSSPKAETPSETAYLTELKKTNGLIKFYTAQMVNSAKVALLRGDETTASHIVDSIDKNILKKYNEIKDEKTNGKKAEAFEGFVLEKIPEAEIRKFEEYYLNQMKILIGSYSELSQFSVERGHFKSVINCVDSLKICNDVLFNPYKWKIFELDNLHEDATDDRRKTSRDSDQGSVKTDDRKLNPYNLSIECIKSASIVSQIAAQRNYGILVEDIAEKMNCMHKAQSEFLTFIDEDKNDITSKNVNIPAFIIKRCSEKRDTTEQDPIPPYRFIKHYIWSIKDAGVSAADNNLEWAAMMYIQCLQEYGKAIYSMIECYDKDGVSNIAKLLTHISSSIREIGQELAERRFQMGTNNAIVAIGELGGLILGDESKAFGDESKAFGDEGKSGGEPKAKNKNKHMMAWAPKPAKRNSSSTDSNPKEEKKLAIVRIILNLKDLGCSAAQNGIEKGVIRTVEQLSYLVKEAWESESLKKEPSRRAETLFRIGENFYEIAMKTKQQGLQEGLTQIIRHNVCCIAYLENGFSKGSDEQQEEPNRSYILDVFIKTFVHLRPVDDFSVESVEAYLSSGIFSREGQFCEQYPNCISPVAPMISDYCSKRSPAMASDSPAPSIK